MFAVLGADACKALIRPHTYCHQCLVQVLHEVVLQPTPCLVVKNNMICACSSARHGLQVPGRSSIWVLATADTKWKHSRTPASKLASLVQIFIAVAGFNEVALESQSKIV